jgi:hypothetical protein
MTLHVAIGGGVGMFRNVSQGNDVGLSFCFFFKWVRLRVLGTEFRNTKTCHSSEPTAVYLALASVPATHTALSDFLSRCPEAVDFEVTPRKSPFRAERALWLRIYSGWVRAPVVAVDVGRRHLYLSTFFPLFFIEVGIRRPLVECTEPNHKQIIP